MSLSTLGTQINRSFIEGAGIMLPDVFLTFVSRNEAMNGALYFSYTDFYNDFYRETLNEGNQNSIYKSQTYNQINGHELWKIENGV